jgi:hypothetical protein
LLPDRAIHLAAKQQMQDAAGKRPGVAGGFLRSQPFAQHALVGGPPVNPFDLFQEIPRRAS